MHKSTAKYKISRIRRSIIVTHTSQALIQMETRIVFFFLACILVACATVAIAEKRQFLCYVVFTQLYDRINIVSILFHLNFWYGNFSAAAHTHTRYGMKLVANKL